MENKKLEKTNIITVNIPLNRQEKSLVNNILLENCMSMVELLNNQKSQDTFNKVVQVMQGTIAVQHRFFESCLESGGNSIEIPEAMAQFLKPMLEGAHENLKVTKEKLIKEGDPNGFSVASACEDLKSLISKLPNPSISPE